MHFKLYIKHLEVLSIWRRYHFQHSWLAVILVTENGPSGAAWRMRLKLFSLHQRNALSLISSWTI